jgi:hypothetical protein
LWCFLALQVVVAAFAVAAFAVAVGTVVYGL